MRRGSGLITTAPPSAKTAALNEKDVRRAAHDDQARRPRADPSRFARRRAFGSLAGPATSESPFSHASASTTSSSTPGGAGSSTTPASACPGAKVGLVGRNGVGKSTLFKLILGELVPDGGEIGLPKAARIGSVDQEHPATPVPCSTPCWRPTSSAPPCWPSWRPPTRAPGRDLRPPDRDRRRPRAGAGRGNPERPRLLHRRPGAADGGVLRRLAHARGAGRGAVRRARPAAARRADQLPRPGGRALARGAAEEIPAHGHDHQPRPRAAEQLGRPHPAPQRRQARPLHRRLRRASSASGPRRLRLQDATRAKIEAKRAHMQAFVDRFRAKASKARQAQSRLKMIAKLPPVADVIEERVAPFTLPSPERPLAPPLIRLEGARWATAARRS